MFPGIDKDHLHCTRCDPSRWWWILWWILLWFLPIWRCEVYNGKVLRRSREPGKPVVHYGTIASGNQVVKDPRVRDRLGQEFGALSVEMEAAGLMNDFLVSSSEVSVITQIPTRMIHGRNMQPSWRQLMQRNYCQSSGQQKWPMPNVLLTRWVSQPRFSFSLMKLFHW